MGLDIDIIRKTAFKCPNCGEIIEYKTVNREESNGRDWYTFLESVGYYVPLEERTSENNWCCKDMMLSTEQAKELYYFLLETHVYNETAILNMVARAFVENNQIVVNANW